MLNKPVYVMCESFKFVRLYPLNQQDLPDEFNVRMYWATQSGYELEATGVQFELYSLLES